MTPASLEPNELKAAVESVRAKTALSPPIGVVLGSGLGDFSRKLTPCAEISYGDIPGFPVPGVPGHTGRLLIGHIRERPLAVLQGRCHLYEGYTAAQVCFPVHVLSELGVKILILTSAAGAVHDGISPGEILFIRDHLNLMGDNPLRGLRGDGRSSFVNMVSTYDRALVDKAMRIAEGLGMPHQSGVLAAVLGPSYETPAEVSMLRTLGAAAVCMSTVPEAIMAKYLGLRVLGLALVTNRAGVESSGAEGGGFESSGHGHVLEVARAGEKSFSDLLERLVEAAGSDQERSD